MAFIKKLKKSISAGLWVLSLASPVNPESSVYFNFSPNHTHIGKAVERNFWVDSETAKEIERRVSDKEYEEQLKFQSGAHLDIPLKRFDNKSLDLIVDYDTQISNSKFDKLGGGGFKPAFQDYSVGLMADLSLLRVLWQHKCLHSVDSPRPGFTRRNLTLELPFKISLADLSIKQSIVSILDYELPEYFTERVFTENGKPRYERHGVGLKDGKYGYYLYNPSLSVSFDVNRYFRPFIDMDLFINNIPEPIRRDLKQHELSLGFTSNIKGIELIYRHVEQAFRNRNNHRYDSIGMRLPFDIKPIF